MRGQGPAWMWLWAALLLACCLLSATKAQQLPAQGVPGGGNASSGMSMPLVGMPNEHKHPSMVLEYCQRVVSKLQPDQMRLLHDSLAQLQRHERLLKKHQINHDRFVEPNPFRKKLEEDPNFKQYHMWEAAYKKYNGTAQDLIKLREHEQAIVDVMRSRANREIASLQQLGRLDAKVDMKAVAPCVFNRINAHNFPQQPEVSFMLQYFKRPWVVPDLVKRMAGCQRVAPSELVVNVDNVEEAAMWANMSYSTEGFVVPVLSNNVHEARAFNRMASIARGRILIIIQDDDLLPESCAWLRDVITMFHRIPQLGAIGHRGYIYSYGSRNVHGTNFFQEPTTKIPFQYVMHVDYAPLSFRRSAFFDVGGVDEGMSELGECGIVGDHEMCARLWKAGWRVGFMPVEREADPKEGGGTHRADVQERCWGKQMRLGANYHFARHAQWNQPAFASMAMRVRELNMGSLQLRVQEAEKFTAKCPFHIGCDLATANISD